MERIPEPDVSAQAAAAPENPPAANEGSGDESNDEELFNTDHTLDNPGTAAGGFGHTARQNSSPRRGGRIQASMDRRIRQGYIHLMDQYENLSRYYCELSRNRDTVNPCNCLVYLNHSFVFTGVYILRRSIVVPIPCTYVTRSQQIPVILPSRQIITSSPKLSLRCYEIY